MTEATTVIAGDARLEVYSVASEDSAATICAAHPAEAFLAPTAELLAKRARARVVCINPRGVGASLPEGPAALTQMVDDVELARRTLGLGRVVFWGMSGGGWLAEDYARRYPDALAGIIIESVCACFRVRLFDPACVLSPLFPAWATKLGELGLLPLAPARANAADAAEWSAVAGIGDVLREPNGPALLVAPGPLPELMRRALPAFFAFDARAWLAEIRVPALVLAGSDDPIAPLACVRAVHEALRDSRFLAIEAGGHVPSAQGGEAASSALREFVMGCAHT